MFDEYNKKFPPYELKKASKKQINAAKSAVFSAIGKKNGIRIKPIIIAVTASLSALALGTGANAAAGGALIKFLMGESELEGFVSDSVDDEGYRHISFFADIPIDEANFAVIFDIEAPSGENVRVITDETDRDFMDKLREYHISSRARKSREAEEKSGEIEPTYPEEYGLIFNDSELCAYELEYTDGAYSEASGGFLGGGFMSSENAEGMPSGASNGIDYNYENGIKTYKYTLYYYVGEENQKQPAYDD